MRIVGHSMGGNVASLWAGARPERLERLVMLEAAQRGLWQNPEPETLAALHELLSRSESALEARGDRIEVGA